MLSFVVIISYRCFVSIGKIWGLSAELDVFKFSPRGWKPRGNLKMKHVSVGADGSTWGIENGTNQVYRWKSKENTWEPVPGTMKHISVGGQNVVWAVGPTNELYHWIEAKKQWESMNTEVGLKQVSVAADGTVIGMGSGSNIDAKLRLKGKLFS